MPDTFAGRNAQHDRAVERVIAVFARHGFNTYAFGTETDGDRANDALLRAGRLASSWDRTSLLLRYRPDRVFTRTGVGALLVEVKSCDRRPNIAIEVASYVFARGYAETGAQVVMCLSFLPSGPEMACSVLDLPGPCLIDVPQRWDAKEQEAFCRKEFPKANLQRVDHRNGSGTAYYVVKRPQRILRPLDEFITRELLKERAPARGASPAQGLLSFDAEAGGTPRDNLDLEF